MIGHLTYLRRSSFSSKVVISGLFIFGIIYCSVQLFGNMQKDPVMDYAGFMLSCPTIGVLPEFLMLLYVGSARYSTFELVRRDPRLQLKTNLSWCSLVGITGALYTWLLFVLVEFAIAGQQITSTALSVSLMVPVQIFMMIVSVGLVCLLLSNFGISWGRLLPIVIGFFALSDWLLKPFAGNATRFVFYFWYPVAPYWEFVVMQQIVPFIVYCLVMVLANSSAFGNTDRLTDQLGD